MEVNKDILSYKNETIKIIETLKTEKYEELGSILDKREEIIVRLKKSNINEEQFKALCNEINLIQLENKLNELLKAKKNDIKFKLEAISRNMQASNSYNKIADEPLIFSKKI